MAENIITEFLEARGRRTSGSTALAIRRKSPNQTELPSVRQTTRAGIPTIKISRFQVLALGAVAIGQLTIDSFVNPDRARQLLFACRGAAKRRAQEINAVSWNVIDDAGFGIFTEQPASE